MPGVKSRVLDWPYVEGLRMDEAMHPLTLLTVGMYGQVLPNQNGAPVRMIVPWKYGFKSAKSIVRIRFVRDQPRTAWNRLAPDEYGFYSNVNPNVDHPRWSQASERRIGEGGLFTPKRKTLMFNGYNEVASLYTGMDLKKYLLSGRAPMAFNPTPKQLARHQGRRVRAGAAAVPAHGVAGGDRRAGRPGRVPHARQRRLGAVPAVRHAGRHAAAPPDGLELAGPAAPHARACTRSSTPACTS